MLRVLACLLFLESFKMLATCASLLLRPFERFVLIRNCDRNFDIAILVALRYRPYYLVVVVELQHLISTGYNQ